MVLSIKLCYCAIEFDSYYMKSLHIAGVERRMEGREEDGGKGGERRGEGGGWREREKEGGGWRGGRRKGREEKGEGGGWREREKEGEGVQWYRVYITFTDSFLLHWSYLYR